MEKTWPGQNMANTSQRHCSVAADSSGSPRLRRQSIDEYAGVCGPPDLELGCPEPTPSVRSLAPSRLRDFFRRLQARESHLRLRASSSRRPAALLQVRNVLEEVSRSGTTSRAKHPHEPLCRFVLEVAQLFE